MCALGSVSGWDQGGVVCWKFLGPGVLKLREEGCGLFGVCAKPWMTRVAELPLVADKDSALFIRPRGSRLAGERVPPPLFSVRLYPGPYSGSFSPAALGSRRCSKQLLLGRASALRCKPALVSELTCDELPTLLPAHQNEFLLPLCCRHLY